MDPLPKISFVMPVHNGERHIAQAIASVLQQRNVDLELIVVNDGSSDNTLTILEQFAKDDSRVRVVTRQNSGRPAVARNDGIAAAVGEYLCFLDHDDFYEADRTERLLAGLEKNPTWVAAFHDLHMTDAAGQPTPGASYLTGPGFLEKAGPYVKAISDDWFECGRSFFIFQSLFFGAVHTMSVMIALKRLPANTVRFDESFVIGEDTDQWIRLALQGEIGFLNQLLGSYRQHEGSITRTSHERYLSENLKVWQHNYYRIQRQLDAYQLGQYRRKISDRFSDLAYLQRLQKRCSCSRESYVQSLRWRFHWNAIFGYLKTAIPLNLMGRLKSD